MRHVSRPSFLAMTARPMPSIPVASLCGLAMLVCAAGGPAARAAERPGHHPDTRVQEPTRIDWVFVLANQSPAEVPPGWLADHESTRQSYDLYVPAGGRGKRPGLVLFISPGDRGTGLDAFRRACDTHNLVFAAPHAAGNGVDTRARVRIVLDVLDDVRRRCGVDPDRSYIGGFSGGGRIACAIGFALPEYFGGLIPVCAAGDLREEPWLRHRAIARLSVACLTGERDFNRGEVERFRGPQLADVGVRSRVWVADGVGHAVPSAAVCGAAIDWLEEGVAARARLARDYPATRVAVDAPPGRDEQPRLLLAEGRKRLQAQQPRSRYEGLMLVKGVSDRWSDVPAGREARAILADAETKDGGDWQAEDIAEQRRFLLARARGLTAYASGPLPPQYAGQRAEMAAAAVELWKLLIEDGQDEAATREAREKLATLQTLVGTAGE